MDHDLYEIEQYREDDHYDTALMEQYERWDAADDEGWRDEPEPEQDVDPDDLPW